MSDILLLAVVFITIAAAVVGVGWWLMYGRKRQPDLLSTLVNADSSTTAQAALMGALRSIGAVVDSSSPRHKSNSLRERLARAGYHNPAAVPAFRGLQIMTGLMPALILGVITLFNKESVLDAAVVAFAAFGFGYLLPEQYLKRRTQARRMALRRGLPNAIDLLVLSLEAGQTIDYASLELSRQLLFCYPELATEFGLVHAELRTGSSRGEALRSFAARTGEPEVRKLANLLADGDRFGTQLANTLRTHARYTRTRMRQQAQEAARKIGVKMVFPLVLLIFPSLLLVTLGPALLQMQQVLGHMFDGF